MEITASICLAFKRSGSPPLKWHLNGGLFDHLNTELTSLVCRSPLLFVIRIQPVHISMKKNISSFMSSLDYTKLCPINLKTGNSKTGILIVRILNGHPIPRLGQPFKHWLYRNKIFMYSEQHPKAGQNTQPSRTQRLVKIHNTSKPSTN